MKCGHLMAPRDTVRREVQGQLPDPERPLLFRVAGDAVLQVERTDRRSNMPWRITRKCRREGFSLESKRPVQAAAMGHIPAASALTALGSAGHGSLAQPPDFWALPSRR